MIKNKLIAVSSETRERLRKIAKDNKREIKETVSVLCDQYENNNK